MMSNANYNTTNTRSRTNPLIKMEKENENLELRKRIKSATKDKHARRETVWDRLSKVRKSPSSENLGINRSRQNLTTKPSQRFQIMKQMAATQQQQQLFYQQQVKLQQQEQQHRRPLTPNSGSNRQGPRKCRLQKATIMPEIDNQGYFYVCKPIKSVQEILTARSLNNSKSSSDGYKTTSSRSLPRRTNPNLESVTSNHKLAHELSEDSMDDYKLAPLMSSRSHNELKGSKHIMQNFQEVLRERGESCLEASSSHYELKGSKHIMQNFQEVLKERGESCLEPEELELVKNVIKYDERYTDLAENSTKLFKDILKTQLQDILKHEYAVKQALDKLESTESLQSCQSNDEIVAYGRSTEQTKKLEVDVVFKNVPSLEREIILLRALGEKLEATLKRTSSQRSVNLKSQESKALNTGPSLMMLPPNDKIPMVVEIKPHSYILAEENYAHSSILTLGLKRLTGIAQEFRMAQKTIVELKQEASRLFYIPLDGDTMELKRTSFNQLKQESPDILMRHIKAKDSTVPFNVLDHDPVFFNNILFNNNKSNQKDSSKVPGENNGNQQQTRIMLQPPSSSKISRENGSQQGTLNILEPPMLCEGGDSRQFEHKSPRKLSTKEKDSNETAVDAKVDKSTKCVDTIARAKQRHRIGCSVTPLSPHKTPISPKNTLFKTILVGSVQISCFMLLIMAFTFPDVKC